VKTTKKKNNDQWVYTDNMIKAKSNQDLCIGVSMPAKAGSHLKLTKCTSNEALKLERSLPDMDFKDPADPKHRKCKK